MRKITFAFLSMLLITPCMANIHINPDVVKEVVAKHFPNKQTECISEYVAQVMASNGAGIAASKLWNVCAAGGLDIKQPADKEKCSTFVKELTSKGTVKFKAVCGDDNSLVQKGTGKCVDNVFSNKVLGGVKVNMLVASGLAKEYARIKYGDKDLVCSKKYRQTKLPPDDYVQCVSMNKDMAYEFRFDSVTATKDYVINEGTESGVCKIFGLKYSPFGSQQAQYLGNWQQISPYQSWPAACETTDAKVCSKVNESITKFGRSAKIGSTGPKGHTRTACVINKNAISSPSQLRTAFGIDNYVFKKGGAQLNATQALKTQVCTYVRTTVKNPAITSCDCNDGFTQLYDFSGMITQVDDVLTCKINGKNVDFVFDDLSESWGTYNKSGHEAMNCIAWGGTFTGKKCIGLDEKMCYKVRDANAQSCPECKKIQWNSKTKICELPASVSATNLKRGLTYSAIVGGAVVGVVITVGTMGAATAPTALILTGLAVETLGAGIELKAQVDIDRTADKFFTQSANCHDAQCAEDLIVEYLKKMSNQQNDMLEEELSAADAELARLADLIPEESDFYQRMFGNGTDLASNETGEWTAAQVWRAVGIGMQSISVLTGVGKWIIKKSPALQKGLQRTTIAFGKKGKILRNARKVALANVVDYDKLDDVGKEWYKLWKQYAPNNQTFDEFKAMANGNLDEMKQMVKNWDGLGKGAAYSTYDPKMSKAFKDFKAKEEELKQWWYDELDKAYQKYLNNGATGDFYKSDEYAQMVKQYYKKDDEARESIPTQWQIAQEFQLKNLANVVDERVAVFDDVLASNPEISSKLQPNNWRRLTNQEKTAVVQQLVDEYATKLGTPKAEIIIEKIRWDWGGYYTPGTNKITLNSRHLNEASLKSILSHEYGHLVDHLDPNAGALGSQYSYYGNKIYSNKISKGYRVALTEQSSFAIGNATDKGEAAINSAATAIIGTSAGAGVEIGVANSILEKQKDKK